MVRWQLDPTALRRTRLLRLLNQTELANKMRTISPNYVSKMECGRANPSMVVLRQLAVALDVDVEEIAYLDEQTQEASEAG